MDVAAAHRRRWWALAVLCLSLLVIGLDNTILNVALPALVARRSTPPPASCSGSSTATRWCSPACCSPPGSLGDRFGRKGALTVGLVIFGVGSVAVGLRRHRRPR